MRAIVLSKIGGSEVLVPTEVKEPVPEKGKYE